MKRLLSLLLALLALCDLAHGQAVNTLSISNSVASSNFFLVSVGNRLVRMASTNVWNQIYPTTSRAASLAINGGTGTTNVIIDFGALLSTNYVRATLTANAGIIVTNIIDGKDVTLEVVQDATGNRTIAASAVGGAPLRFGTDVTAFGLSTNGTYLNKIRLHGSGTNAQVVGMLRGYAP